LNAASGKEKLMRKWLGWSLGALFGLFAGLFLLQIIASESGEVVVLHTAEGAGTATTRLWVVEHDGDLWLRSGGGESGWYARLQADARIKLERGGRTLLCVAEPEPAMRDVINDLMAAKYGWRDRVIGIMVGGRDAAIPVRVRSGAECIPAES